MKKSFGIVGRTVSALLFLAGAANGHALNIEFFVDPNTWEFKGWQGDSDGAVVNFADHQASHQDQYGVWHYRYFAGGHFDNVVIETPPPNPRFLLNLPGCNNIFYIDRLAQTAYECAKGYNGTGNGTGGEVQFATGLSNGDFVIGGQFGSAGGYEYTSFFSCYQWDSGWSGANGIMLAGNRGPDQWALNTVYQLHVISGPTTVWGPTTSGGPIQTISVPDGYAAFWNEFHYPFADG